MDIEYPLLRDMAVQEMEIIKLSLEELSRSWQTAKESLRVLQSLREAVSAFPRMANPAPLQPDDLLWQLFQPFGTSFSTTAQVISEHWEKNPAFVDASAPDNTMQTVSRQNDTASTVTFQLGTADPSFSASAVDSLGSTEDAPVDFSPQTVMDNVLQDILAQSHFCGEDWFFRDMQNQ